MLCTGRFILVESVFHYELSIIQSFLCLLTGMDEAVEIQSTFFPALAKFVKSKEHKPELEEGFMQQVNKLNDHLTSKKTKYFAGEQISLVDFNLAPKLYHMSATLAEFYPDVYEKVVQMDGLKNYMDVIFNEKAFQDSIYPKETIIWGWTAARG